jgi:hypothetical protein
LFLPHPQILSLWMCQPLFAWPLLTCSPTTSWLS